MAILVLGANTAYSDFPRLSYFLARDRYMPRQFTFRGDRLAFTTGIVTLGLLASVVLAVYGGESKRMIPLYAVGVFTAFTLCQFGMVTRWRKRRSRAGKRAGSINLVGASATALVAIVVAVTQIPGGAWIILVLIPLLILMFRAIHRHYQNASRELADADAARSGPRSSTP